MIEWLVQTWWWQTTGLILFLTVIFTIIYCIYDARREVHYEPMTYLTPEQRDGMKREKSA